MVGASEAKDYMLTGVPYPYDQYDPWRPPLGMDAFQESLVLEAYPAGTRIVGADSYRPGYMRYPLRARVRLPGGREDNCVLKVDPLRGGIEREAKVLPVLAGLGLPVPVVLAGPVPHPDYPDAGAIAVLSELPGDPLPWIEATLEEIDLTCRLHQAAVDRLHELTDQLWSTGVGRDIPRRTMLSELGGIIRRGGPWLQVGAFSGALRRLRSAKFIIWGFDRYGWGSKGGLVERYLYAHDVSRSDFASRLALRCLWRLQRDTSVAGERDAFQREAIVEVLEASLASLPDV
jgi:hypothetical protein